MAKLNNGAIQLLPGLNYTDEQMFFLAFGQVHVGMHHEHISFHSRIGHSMRFVPSFRTAIS